MTLKTIVKVGNITNLSDARYCAGMGVDMLGFCLDKTSEHYIEIEKLQEITNWVSGVEIIAEFNQEDQNDVKNLTSSHNFDGILTANIETANYWKYSGRKVIFEVKISSENQINEVQSKLSDLSQFDFIQLTCENKNFIATVKDNLSSWSKQINILKSFDIEPNNIEGQIEEGLFKGIALSGTHEERPGMKDYDEIADILESIESES